MLVYFHSSPQSDALVAVVKKTDLMVQLVLDWPFSFHSRISKFYKTDIVLRGDVQYTWLMRNVQATFQASQEKYL